MWNFVIISVWKLELWWNICSGKSKWPRPSLTAKFYLDPPPVKVDVCAKLGESPCSWAVFTRLRRETDKPTTWCLRHDNRRHRDKINGLPTCRANVTAMTKCVCTSVDEIRCTGSEMLFQVWRCWHSLSNGSARSVMLRKHSLGHTAEKCLTYIGGIFLRKDECKQQQPLSVFIKPQCEKPCSWYSTSVVWKTKFSCCSNSQIPPDHNLICWKALKTKRFYVYQYDDMFTAFLSRFRPE